jgi:hypothetical protein
MAKVKKKSPRKSPSKKRPASAPDANLLVDLLKWAKAAGADSADAVYVNGESISVAQRMGEREKLESSEGRDLGLRVFVGQRQAFVSSTDFAVPALRTLAQRAVDMARIRSAASRRRNCWPGAGPTSISTTSGGPRPGRYWRWRRRPRMRPARSRA